VLPEKDEAWRQRLVRDSFDALGVGVFECIRAWWGSIDSIRPQVQIEGLEHLRQMQAEGRGVLLVSGHFMTLEMCGACCATTSILSGMYRKHKNPVYEWAVKFGRLRYAKAMFANEDIRATVRHLKKGGFLWYAPDQDMRGKDTVFVPFFGHTASTITATHQLARMTGCAVIPYFHRREGGKYFLKIGAPLENFPSEDVEADTTRVNQAIEEMVREAPTSTCGSTAASSASRAAGAISTSNRMRWGPAFRGANLGWRRMAGPGSPPRLAHRRSSASRASRLPANSAASSGQATPERGIERQVGVQREHGHRQRQHRRAARSRAGGA
jgi:KDO2-lipid IV(A) lauroyltransferase